MAMGERNAARVLGRLLSPGLVCGCWLVMTGPADACSVPVFRYALERWRPDPYEVLIYHRGPLSDDQAALVERLGPVYVPGEPFPNTAASTVDLDGRVRPEFAEIWRAEAGPELPWIIVRTPWKGANETVWSGPLSESSVRRILTSPVRAEIIRRLVEGDSVVWLLVSGRSEPADAALLYESQSHLQRLQSEIELPAIRPEDLRELSVAPERLGLRFSLLRVDRTSDAEALLVQSLLSLRPELQSEALADEPLLFPVFGRGRAFFPLVGEQIDAAGLDELARFLCGACQCTVKQQNPGIDLLTAVDWDAYVLGITGDRPLPPLTGLAGFGAAPDVEESAASTPPAAGDSPPAAAAPLAESQHSPASGERAASRGALGSSLIWTMVGLTLLVVIVTLLSAARRGA